MSIEQNIENLEIRNANVVTFVGSSSTIVDTISGRIQCKGFQHNSNVITDISGPHGRGAAVLKKYPEIAFDASKADVFGNSNAYAQAGYEISSTSRYETGVAIDANDIKFAFDGRGDENGSVATPSTLYPHYASQSSSYSTSNPFAYTLFTNNVTDKDGVNYSGEEIKLKLPNKIKLSKLNIVSFSNSGDRQARNGHIFGSNTGANGSWTKIIDFTNLNSVGGSSVGTKSVSVSTVEYFEWYSLVITHLADSGGLLNLRELEYYGYEEDPPAGDHSVDTTFKSRFNNPQLTGVQVFVDGKGSGSNQIAGGPTVTDVATTYNEPGKYWELTGELTSNIAVEANTFLEGDQPHAVSVWFNSSNLEANVSNTCVFSVSDQEKLDSVNLDLQSNTWHNLTYAYQGEGGSKVTYLDGRKVAEDQAEDTFGEYPPIEIGTYSLGGYTVDASYWNLGGSNREAFNMFRATGGGRVTGFTSDGSGGAILDTADANYDVALMTLTDTSGTAHLGHWVSLELPYKLSPTYCEFEHYVSSYRLKDFVILGSNDNPRIIKTGFTLLFSGQAHVDNNGTNKTIHTFTGSGKFKYLILLTKTLNTGNSTWIINRLKYYGHRENDLVRLPDPTNVLKYPHVTMTGPAQRGYVASASGHTGSGYPWEAFLNDPDSTNGFWHGVATEYNVNSNSLAIEGTAPLTDVSGSPVHGAWIQLQFPHSIIPTRIDISPRTGQENRAPKAGVLAGSDNGTDWYTIYTISGATNYTAATYKTFTFTNTTSYKYLRLIVTQIGGGGGGVGDKINIGNIEFYGTEEGSVPIQIGGGNIDRVANFRVYDKFIEEDQVNEIWNAQKEEFGRAKPQMVLQQGKLGIGTDAPQGSLSVADEPDPTTYGLQEFPPKPLAGYKTHFEGHGVFCVSASSFVDLSVIGGTWSKNIYPWDAFNKTNTYGWVSTSGVYTNGLADSDSDNRFGILGEWLEIEMPSKIKLKHFTLSLGYDNDNPSGTNTSRFPKVFNLYKSNDGVTWTSAMEITTPTAPGEGAYGTTYTYNINESEYYNRYLIQVKQTHSNTSGYTNPSSHAAIGEWRLFGYREQLPPKQSVLHDGQLTLTKSLTVPRIGPALDADDTPRRDRLVVEYNTSTNPTFEGAVRDTSGRGNDGVFMGTATYDANEKAFTFPGSGMNTIQKYNLGPDLKGNQQLTVSLWFKTNDDRDQNLFGIIPGDRDENGSPSTDNKVFGVRTEGDSTDYNLLLYYWNSDYRYNVPELDSPPGKWLHLVVMNVGGTKTGSGTTFDRGDPSNRRLFLNGVELFTPSSTTFASAVTGSASDILDLDPNSRLIIGARYKDNGEYPLDGSVSQFKLYDTALTDEEVKTLYDMGRCDEGHHVVNFSKTRVGIGLGDGEAPRGALDVRGNMCVGPGTLPKAYWFQPALTIFETGPPATTGSTGGAGNQRPGGGIQFCQYNSPGQGWMMGVDTDDSGCELVWEFHNNGVRSGKGAQLSAGAVITSINFTGQHRTFIKDVPFSQAGDLEGLIVSSDQNKYIKMSGGIEAGSNAITTNESLPIVSLSNVMTDKKCFGVISASEDPKQRTDAYGNFKSFYPKEKGDTRVYINSVGEGAIWVSNIGGNLEAGDYITTSNVAGYGQKQDSDSLKNYTVAKITMDCDFEPATQPIQQILRSNVIQTYYLGDVHKVKTVPHEFVTTTVGADDTWSNVSVKPSDVTYAEWSNLEANTQNTYNLTYTQTSNVVYDTKYTLTTTANVTESDAWDRVSIDPPDVTYAQYSNLEANTQSSYSLTFTKTTTDEKTTEEWSALESNTQSLYNMVYYQSVEEEVASDYPGATTHTRVTDVIENELDEHGQIQWEDHATETEKAYKVRYLAADGTQTDEANAVHIAAFVGCTYHCG